MQALPTRVVGALLLLLSTPLLVMIAGLLMLVLGRPILFRQDRAGLHARPFEMIKFRTMSLERDRSGKLLPDDQRLSALGRVLRRSRLDELPELINIARGDMAFVGPRPLLLDTISAMGEGGTLRCTVRPGLTGWAQVSGNTLLSNREKLALDLWYVSHRSLMLDLEILIRTPAVLLLGERRHSKRLADVQ
ncbi:sugar transferase [Sphingomonas arenae]|uniref:sugar transferase n=1 Tax=Sphingomonas arenae TaxID=2812555 RepID=UPI001967E992|nr:sugar transferase [Sphingomonas arenae]